MSGLRFARDSHAGPGVSLARQHPRAAPGRTSAGAHRALHAARRRIQLAELARDLGVSVRTAARDVERLRDGGVPLDVRPGRGGGVALRATTGSVRLELDLPEAAALMSSLAVLGPTVTPSAASAMRKLVAAMAVE